MGFHMNETTDMPKNTESGNREISDEAMRKFDKLMGDDDLPENPADFRDSDCLLEDPETEYYTSYEERLKCTPAENCDYGRWEGGRGESLFIPYNKEAEYALESFDQWGIPYKNGIADFGKVSEETVDIDCMTTHRHSMIDLESGERITGNFEKADAKCAEKWNEIERDGKSDWTARDVAVWRSENGYTWHEDNNMKTCNLVPHAIHNVCKHSGGVAECRRRDMEDIGGGFDE